MRRPDPVRLVAALVLVAGLAAVGTWAWQSYGTSWLADREEAATLDEFTAAHPLPTAVADGLRTDVENAPTADFPGLIGTLWVPSWTGAGGVHGDVNDGRTPIKEGVTEAVLASGAAGRFPQGVGPGEVGNFALAGHRRTYGDNFLHVDDLVVGDVAVVETPEAWYVYRVVDPPRLVLPEDGADVVEDAPHGLPAGGRYLTLVSCHSVTDGEWGNDHRIVVHAELTGWLARDEGLPPELAYLGPRG